MVIVYGSFRVTRGEREGGEREREGEEGREEGEERKRERERERERNSEKSSREGVGFLLVLCVSLPLRLLCSSWD